MSDPVSYLQAMDDAACRSCETRKRLAAELQPFLEQEAQEIASHEAIMKDRGLTECTTFGPAAIQRMAEQQERRQRDPDFILPLSEYKALQARVLAAELALAGLKEYAGKTFDLWDKDQESKVGKRLMWMSGAGNRNYEPDLEHIHAVSPEAARELMRKAAQYDIMQGIRMTLDERLAESMTNSGMIPEEIIQASMLLGALIHQGFGKVKPENGFVCSLKIEDGTFLSFEARYEDGEPFVKSALKWKGDADALAGLRAEVLEEVLQFAESEASFAVEAEKQAACKVGELQYAIRWAHRAETLEAFANKIRDMKAPEKGGKP
jgi:DNA-binding Lrp family transcriptional regulator